MRILWIAVFVTGCGASPPDGGRASVDTPRGADGAPTDTDDGVGTVTRQPGDCPKRYGEDAPPSCTEGDTPSECAYPEGTCGCESPVWCGGAAPPPMPFAWMCEAHREPCAASGSPCAEPGATCSRDDCGWSGVRCVDGVWQAWQSEMPP